MAVCGTVRVAVVGVGQGLLGVLNVEVGFAERVLLDFGFEMGGFEAPGGDWGGLEGG